MSALFGQEDPNGPAVFGVMLTEHQSSLLHAIEVAGEGGAVEDELLREVFHVHPVLLPQAGQAEAMVVGDAKPPQPPIIKLRDLPRGDIHEKAEMLSQLRHRSPPNYLTCNLHTCNIYTEGSLVDRVVYLEAADD